MSDTLPSDYGPRLARYIDQLRGATSVREFSRTHRLDHQRISLWGSGRTPSYRDVQVVAEGLGISYGEVLVIMGVGKPEDFTVTVGTSVRQAIEEDPELSEKERAALRSVHAALLDLRHGYDSVTVNQPTSGPTRIKRT
ncbi:MAG TPA: hypothetical protein VJ851_00850 [Jatrophihabitans sp.]|nr:hypothetical protein [Jatrophihabitans sp.]